ncbi:MAG: hypothetical protein QM669_12845 [Siphonobacter sp.]
MSRIANIEMKYFLGIILLLTGLGTSAQQPDTPEERLLKTAPTQGRALTSRQSVKYLAIDYPGGRKRFFAGDDIVIKVRGQRGKVRDAIYAITDTSIVFAELSEITNRAELLQYPLKDVKKVYFMKDKPLVTQAGYLLPLAGALYFVMDVFSPVWNKELKGAPIQVTASTAIVSGGLLGLGVFCYKNTHKALRIGNRNRIKVLRTY